MSVKMRERKNGCIFTMPDGSEIEIYINSNTPNAVTVMALGSAEQGKLFGGSLAIIPGGGSNVCTLRVVRD